ncbi:MAG: 3'-5' exonuclease [Myxococcota bacterium]
MPHRIVREELDLLDRVSDQLAKAAPRPRVAEEAAVRELERLRGLILDREGTKDDIPALYDEWRRQSNLLSQLRASRAGAEIDVHSPYFGHMRLRAEDDERELCIGKATRIEAGLRIVDWRNAPISRLFFRCQQGEDFEEEFGGRVMQGRVVARRVVKISAGELQQIDAPEGSFRARADPSAAWERVPARAPRLGAGEVEVHGPEGHAGRRLGGADPGLVRADKRLPEITSLLDPEQFQLITRPSAGFLVIRGVAGSGKTTVALHRIAYLAYDDKQIDSSRTLVLVFSRALQKYVEHLLPALGLSRVGIRTYADWAFERRCRHFPQLPKSTREDTPSLIRSMKLHPALLRALEAEISAEPGEADGEQALDDWTNLLVNADRLWEHFGADPGSRFSRADVEEFTAWHRRRQEVLSDYLAEGADREAELDPEGGDPQLDPEDDPLLLRAWQLRVGPLRGRRSGRLRYRHVTIDEVQDFSPLEIQVLLRCLDRQQSITLSGDTQQHVTRTGGFDSWPEFLERVGVPGSAVETLRIPYRSTREIVAFSLSLLGDLREEGEVAEAPRSGPPVELFRFNDRGSCVSFLAEALEALQLREPLASVVLLTSSQGISREYEQGFVQTDVRLRRVADYDFSFEPGFEITEIAQTKGLEFDYVILLDVDPANYPDDSFHRRLLHVGATRAIQQLWITCIDVPSAIVRGACAQHG